MQGERTVRIHHTLGVAGRAGRVAHRGGAALVRIGEVAAGRRAGDQRVVVEVAVAHRLGCADHDRDRHADLRLHLFPQRQQGFVDDHRSILGVVDDVGELVGMKAKVQRVQDAAHQRDAEIGLEVRPVIPAEGCDAIAWRDAEVEQRLRQTPRTDREVGAGVAADRLVSGAPDDFLPPEQRFGAAKDRRQRERVVHHQAVHGANCMRNRRSSVTSSFHCGGRTFFVCSRRLRFIGSLSGGNFRASVTRQGSPFPPSV